MEKKLIENLKSNKGFTIQDAGIAIIILLLFAGVIGGSYITIYQVQSETKLSAVTNIYAIQILENLDKISYEEVVNGMEEKYRTEYGIPNTMGLKLEVNSYDQADTVKKIRLTMNYDLSNQSQELVLEKLKVKEL